MSDKIFVDGFIFKLPADNAPAFVKGKISIKIPDFSKWVKEHKDGDWLNIDLKVSKENKPYAELNTYKKESGKTEEDKTDLPF